MKNALSAIALAVASINAQAVTIGFEVPTQHSDWWKAWAWCGDYPWLNTEAERNPVLTGTISFDIGAIESKATVGGFLYEFALGDYVLRSNQTDGVPYGVWTATVRTLIRDGHFGGFIDLTINGGPDWRPEFLHLAVPASVAAIPEPETWALLLAGVAILGLRKRAS